MKSDGDDKTNDVGSCAAQLLGVAQKVVVCLSAASASLCLSLLRLAWLAACLALPAFHQLCILFAIPYEYEVLLGAQLGAQLLTLLDLCRYHLEGVQPASVVPHHLHRLRGPPPTSRFTNEANGAKKAKRKGTVGPFYPRAYQVSIACASPPPEPGRISKKVFPHLCSASQSRLFCFFGIAEGAAQLPRHSLLCLVRLLFPEQDNDGGQRVCRVA